MKALLALLVLPSFAFAQKPTDGKVKMHVSAGEAGVYKGLQQRIPDLEQSARKVRLRLGSSKWVESTNDIEEADIRVVVLGQREDPDKGIAIGYSIDAGAYKTEDEIFDASEEATVRGGAARDVRSSTDVSAQKSKASYDDLAIQFADQLSYFCEQNYQRIVSQRK